MSTKINYLLLGIIFLLVAACGESSELDRVFKPGTYKKEYQILFRSPEVSGNDLFLINYVIMRHQDHFSYEIEGKTYRELLAMAKKFEQEGMSVEEVYQQNGEQTTVQQSIINDGAGSIRRANDARKIIRALLFTCEYENTSKSDIVLLSSSFLINGPFKSRITTAGYEVNCVLKAGEKTKVNFAVSGKTISDNLKFKANNYTEYLMVDSLFQNIEIEVAGNTIQKDTRFFGICNFKTRLEPFQSYKMGEDEALAQRKTKKADGTTKIDWGAAHYLPKEQKEPINMQ
ncbi:MAG: hypothetical protein AB8G15_22715 [Saprospiraceae bacterium]